jgi:AcrR family transcriptional regulator
MSTSRRKQTHEATRDEIKSIAWKAVVDGGPQALSLGVIARELGVTTPALYRYFKSRNDLLSELIGEAYSDIATELENAIEDKEPDDYPRRFRALFTSYRNWALSNPQKYFLMFGVPSPDFVLLPDAGKQADHSFLLLLEELYSADQDGKIDYSSTKIEYTPALKARLLAVKHQNRIYSEKVTYLALEAWSFIHGLVSLEISGGYALILGDTTEDFFQLEVNHFLNSIGSS